MPTSLEGLDGHNCITVDAMDVWRLVGPDGEAEVRPYSNVRANSSEFVRELVFAGGGIGLLSTWEIGQALREGALQVVLPEYQGTPKIAIHAVYPSREFVPAKVSALIEFLVHIFGPHPAWDRDIDPLIDLRSLECSSPRRLAKGQATQVATR
jgi:DNA-binding transcriptional LysR family regulator